jgi:hypothetical protein
MLKQIAFPSCIRAIAALALGSVFSTSVFAADDTQPKFNPAAVQKALASRQSLIAASSRASRSGASADAKEIFLNSNAAYPPSCLNDGLTPFGATGLPYVADPNAKQFLLTLLAFDSSNGTFDIPEVDTFTIYRVPCSGGFSATLLEIDRPTAVNGSTTQFPTFPNIFLTQNGNGYANCSSANGTCSYPRLPQDPNTFFSDTELESPLFYSSVYVLEYYQPSATLSNSQIDYNQAFTLNVDTLSADASGNEIVGTANVPAYSPASFNNYPSSSAPMEISGYMSTNWSSPTQSGEGIVLQVYDNGDQATRTLSFAWFTYDDMGLPFWLYGQGGFNIGATSVTATTVYFKGGSFEGSLSSGVPHTSWGTVTFSFPDCNDMNIAYSGSAAADNGPTATGNATYSRVAGVNGLVCQ